jgi:hypothetical protein
MIADPVQRGFDPAYHLIDLALEVIMTRTGLRLVSFLSLPEPGEVGAEQVTGVLDRVGQRGLGAMQIVGGCRARALTSSIRARTVMTSSRGCVLSRVNTLIRSRT